MSEANIYNQAVDPLLTAIGGAGEDLYDQAIERLIEIRDQKRREEAIERRADEAWSMVAREEDPMPLLIALDYVQEVLGDRYACVLAIVAAAARSLASTRVRGWRGHLDWHCDEILGSLCERRWASVCYVADHLKWRIGVDKNNREASILEQLPEDYPDRLIAWACSAQRAAWLCEQLFAALEGKQ